jgi:hypothetical protein
MRRGRCSMRRILHWRCPRRGPGLVPGRPSRI